MNREREEKIRRYKESKELEGSIKSIKVKLGEDHCDEEASSSIDSCCATLPHIDGYAEHALPTEAHTVPTQ